MNNESWLWRSRIGAGGITETTRAQVGIGSSSPILKRQLPARVGRVDVEPTSQGRHRGLAAVGVLMILFGTAEVTTAFTHKFLGISTALGAFSALLASGIGALYTVSGLLLLTMRRRAAAVAVACLLVVVVGRIALVVSSVFPLDSFEQIFAMTVGTGIVAFFAAYIGWNWQSFR